MKCLIHVRAGRPVAARKVAARRRGMFGRGQGRGGRGRGRFTTGQRPISEDNRISIADRLAEFQASDDSGLVENVAARPTLLADLHI